MLVKFHLVVNRNGTVKTLKSKPSLNWDEISMQLQLTIPNALFDRPQFKAELTIPETAVQSTDVPVELTDNIQEAIQQLTGYNVSVSLIRETSTL